MLPHGYTNDTVAVGTGLVLKSYVGSDWALRQATESLCLTNFRGLPVPLLISDDEAGSTLMQRLPGRPGQDLIDEGRAYDVLHAVGELHRRLQTMPIELCRPRLSGTGTVVVHGDFGPHNMLFDDHCQVTGLLDWEFAHVGEPVEDLAWAEWIVRMHHAQDSEDLHGLFAGSGWCPTWRYRQEAMMRRCQELYARCLADGRNVDAKTWNARLEITTAWRECP